jgi:uncharacterized protein (TIGR02118 family)
MLRGAATTAVIIERETIMKHIFTTITLIMLIVVGSAAAFATRQQGGVDDAAKGASEARQQRRPYKVVILIKRKAGTSMDDFIAYYESTHSRLVEKYLAGRAVRYVRRYLYALSPTAGNSTEPIYDVITEMWFMDSADWHAALTALSAPEASKVLADEEAKFTDLTRTRVFAVDEHDSLIKK